MFRPLCFNMFCKPFSGQKCVRYLESRCHRIRPRKPKNSQKSIRYGDFWENPPVPFTPPGPPSATPQKCEHSRSQKMAGQSNPYTPKTFSAVLPLKNGIFTVKMHMIKWGWAYLRKKNYFKYAHSQKFSHKT